MAYRMIDLKEIEAEVRKDIETLRPFFKPGTFPEPEKASVVDKFLGNVESSIVRYPLQWVVTSALVGLIVGWVL